MNIFKALKNYFIADVSQKNWGELGVRIEKMTEERKMKEMLDNEMPISETILNLIEKIERGEWKVENASQDNFEASVCTYYRIYRGDDQLTYIRCVSDIGRKFAVIQLTEESDVGFKLNQNEFDEIDYIIRGYAKVNENMKKIEDMLNS